MNMKNLFFALPYKWIYIMDKQQDFLEATKNNINTCIIMNGKVQRKL